MQYSQVFQNTHLHYATITKHGKEIACSRNRVAPDLVDVDTLTKRYMQNAQL